MYGAFARILIYFSFVLKCPEVLGDAVEMNNSQPIEELKIVQSNKTRS